MSKMKKWMRSEADVEFFACVHAISMVFLFGLELYVYGIKDVPYEIIFEMFLLSYFISWMQKLLFFREKIYSDLEFKIREFLWSVGPVTLTVIIGRIFNWYRGLPEWIEVVFLVIMLIYYAMLWFGLQLLYKDETNSLNQMLTEFKISKTAINNNNTNKVTKKKINRKSLEN